MDKNLHLSVSRYNALCISSLGNRLQTPSTDNKHGVRSIRGATFTAGQAHTSTWASCDLGLGREEGRLAVRVIPIAEAGSVPGPTHTHPRLGWVAEGIGELKLPSTLKAWKEGEFRKCGLAGKSGFDAGEHMKTTQRGPYKNHNTSS